VASALPLLVSYSADNTGLGFRAPIRAFSSSVHFRISQIAWEMGAQAGVHIFRVNHNSPTPSPW